jgi:hypothetical protein
MGTELKRLPPTDEIIRRIAMDVGKQVVEHIEWAHSDMVKAARSWKSSRLSIRNCVHNSIMSAVQAADEGRYEEWIANNDEHRRKMRAARRVIGMQRD